MKDAPEDWNEFYLVPCLLSPLPTTKCCEWLL